MVAEVWEIYKEALELGIPVEIIILLFFFASVGYGSFKVVKYMRQSKKEILEQQEKVSRALIDNTTQLSSIVVGLQESVGILTNMNFRLEHMTKPDERIVESQAKIIYDLLMQELFDSIKENYFNIRDWIDLKELDLELDKNKSNINERLILIFDSNLKNLEDKMRNFQYNDKSLSIYLDSKFRAEYNDLKQHIYSLLIEKENGVRSYLEQKKDLFCSDFNTWLKEL